jgi:hypothetical protein
MVVDIGEFIETRLKPQIDWYDKKSIQNKRFAYLFNIITIFCGALTPIFAAIDFKDLTIVFGVVVAISLGLLKFCKFEEHWHNYRTTCETLRKEEIFFKFSSDVYANATNPQQLFVERVESLISRENTLWLCTVKESANEDDALKRT